MTWSPFVKPQTDILKLSNDQWIVVKRRLTAGEARRAYAKTVLKMTVGERTVLNPEVVGLSKIMAYLLDWSFDAMPIREQEPAFVEAALDQLDEGVYDEIWEAINTHEKRVQAAIEEEKKLQAGANSSSPTSPSAV